MNLEKMLENAMTKEAGVDLLKVGAGIAIGIAVNKLRNDEDDADSSVLFGAATVGGLLTVVAPKILKALVSESKDDITLE